MGTTNDPAADRAAREDRVRRDIAALFNGAATHIAVARGDQDGNPAGWHIYDHVAVMGCEVVGVELHFALAVPFGVERYLFAVPSLARAQFLALMQDSVPLLTKKLTDSERQPPVEIQNPFRFPIDFEGIDLGD